MRWATLLVACVAACGRVGFDATTDGGTAIDAAPTTGTWTHVVANWASTCAIQSSGEAWCWGGDLFRQLGTGGPSAYSRPAAVLPGSWASIALGRTFGCGIQRDGTLWCWGADDTAQIPDGTTPNEQGSPVPIGTDTDWVEVTSAERHGCARKADNSLWCWGDNEYRQFDPTVPSSSTPRLVRSNVRSVSTGYLRTHVVDTDGSLWVAGLTLVGEGGTGTFGGQFAGFTRAGTDSDWSAVSAGFQRACATKTDGSLWCFGDNSNGGLGNGSSYYAEPSPIRLVSGADNWQTAILGFHHTCATRTDGTAWCWGAGTRGEIGALSALRQLTPASLGPIRSIATGDHHTCYVTSDGVLRCSGSNDAANIKVPMAASLSPIAAGGTWSSVTAGNNNACGISATGELACWGDGDGGKLGTGTEVWSQVPDPIGSTGWTAVAVRGYETVGIRNGELFRWGVNPANGAVSRTPLATLSTFTDFTRVAAGREHACALRANTDLYCWGINGDGQIGDGTMTNRASPVLVGTGFTQIVAGDTHTCGVQSGTRVCWGENINGTVGDNTTTDALDPTVVSCTGQCSAMGVKEIVIGGSWSCALNTDGTLWCWGGNGFSQFGNASFTPSLVAVRAADAIAWSTVAAGDAHMCGIDTSGRLWCWGHGDAGQIGQGTTSPSLVPIQISADTDWASLALGNHVSCAIKTTGARYCWGANIAGTYGDGLSWLSDFVTVSPKL